MKINHYTTIVKSFFSMKHCWLLWMFSQMRNYCTLLNWWCLCSFIVEVQKRFNFFADLYLAWTKHCQARMFKVIDLKNKAYNYTKCSGVNVTKMFFVSFKATILILFLHFNTFCTCIGKWESSFIEVLKGWVVTNDSIKKSSLFWKA